MKLNRHRLTFLGLVLLLATSLATMIIPDIRGKTVGQVAAWSLVLSVAAGGAAIWGRPNRWFFATCAVGLLVFPFVAIARIFGRIDLMSLVFHFQFGTEGTTLTIFEVEMREAAFAVLVLLFVAYAASNLYTLRRGGYVIAIAMLVVLNTMSLSLLHSAVRPAVESDLHQRLVQPAVTRPSVRPDIILVYLEGLERTFANRDTYGSLYEPIGVYESQGVSFTNIAQIEGTTWSLGGLVATQCGVPILHNGLLYHNDFVDQREFMPDRICLGDVTSAMGYRNAFVVGGDKAFGGIDHFLETHGVTEITDRSVIEDMYSAEEIAAADATGWVLGDQIVFDASLRVYDQLVVSKDPILLTIETFGPHGSTATLSRRCTADGLSVLSPNLESAVACTLTVLDQFLDDFVLRSNGRPTVVVLLSDHLNHDKEFQSRQPYAERRNTAVFFPIGFEPQLGRAGSVGTLPGSMIDIYPSLLAYIGRAAPDNAAGLGRSLFGSGPTILAEKGLSRLNQELVPNAALADVLWRSEAE